jgi:hypothetical protein
VVDTADAMATYDVICAAFVSFAPSLAGAVHDTVADVAPGEYPTITAVGDVGAVSTVPVVFDGALDGDVRFAEFVAVTVKEYDWPTARPTTVHEVGAGAPDDWHVNAPAELVTV